MYVRDIVGNKDAVERLQVISEEGNMPNIILSVLLPPPPLGTACAPHILYTYQQIAFT